MRFDVRKAENCFAESQSYEYRLPLDGQSFSSLLEGWEVRENHKFRRPLFIADKGGINVKGILKANVIKASFPEARWQEEKESFERWLNALEE